MNPNSTHWMPGVLMLSLGLVAAGLYLFFGRRGQKPTNAPVAPDLLADVDRRVQQHLEELRALEQERHLLTEPQYLTEKQRLEQLAAQALRDRDETRAVGNTAVRSGGETTKPGLPSRPPVAAQGYFARNPQLKGALWGGGAVLFFVVLGLLLTREQKPRDDKGTMTGKTPPGNEASASAQAPGEPPPPDPQLDQAMAELKRNPEDVVLAARVGHSLIRRQDFQNAFAVTERALGVDPFHPENRVHRAFLKAIFGNEDGAMTELQHVADSLPDSHEALLFLGMIQMQRGKNQQALAAFERYVADAPSAEQPPQIQTGMEALRREVQQGRP